MSDPVANQRASYSLWNTVSLRYSDMDMLGHVNNAVFATLLESGRVAMLFRDGRWGKAEGTTFVLRALSISFDLEMHYPGDIEVGTSIVKFGNSSIALRQALFQGDKCCATSESTIVLMDEATHKATPIPEAVKAELGTP